MAMINGKKLANVIKQLTKELGRAPLPSEVRDRLEGR